MPPIVQNSHRPPRLHNDKRRNPIVLDYNACEPRHLLATLAEAGISQTVIDLINNQGAFANTFKGDIGPNNNGSPDVVYTDYVLNDLAFQHTVDAIAATETVPVGAQLITTKTQLLNNISSGSVANPNVYLVQGDFTLSNSETIELPGNVEVYVDGSIFKQGTFTAPGVFNSGGGGESENSESFIFRIHNSDNVKLIGIDNARLHSNPTFDTTQPHATAVRITGNASDVLVDGFEIDYVWQGIDASYGTKRITAQNNYLHDILKRAIWYLGSSDSAAVHNFIVNPGVDGIDFDAYVADSVAYENVMIGAGRFAFFVEEGANNNFSVRNLSIIYRLDNPNSGFQLGNASNGTSIFFANNNIGEFTRDNFFVDNVTFQPSTQRTNQGGDFIAQGDIGVGGNTYFYANRMFGVKNGSEGPSGGSGRNLAFKALYEELLPAGLITTANDVRFDNADGFHEYDIVSLLNGWDATYNTTTTPIRPEILPPAPTPVKFQETGGKVVIEAEHFTQRVGGTGNASGRHWNLLIDDTFGGTQSSDNAASGDQGLVAERNTNVHAGTSLIGPRVDYDIQFDTPGLYKVFIRTRATISDATTGSSATANLTAVGSNSVQLGLDGISFTNSSGSGVGNDNTLWTWTDDVIGGTQGITVNVATAGTHTLNIWMREDGVEIDKIVLDQTGSIPTGFGPAESDLVSTPPPVVASVVRDGSPIDQPELLDRPDLLNTISITFDQNVNVVGNDLAVLDATDGSQFVGLGTNGFSYNPATFTATWDFNQLVTTPLDAAFYTIFLNSGITGTGNGSQLDGNGDGTAGDLFVQDFYVAIPGDANLDGDVDVSELDISTFTNVGDASILLGNLGVSSGATWSQGNFNGDGDVDVSEIDFSTFLNVGDAAILLAHLGQDVRPAGAATASSSARTVATTVAVEAPVGLPLISELDETSDDVFGVAPKATIGSVEPLELVGSIESTDVPEPVDAFTATDHPTGVVDDVFADLGRTGLERATTQRTLDRAFIALTHLTGLIKRMQDIGLRLLFLDQGFCGDQASKLVNRPGDPIAL